MGNDLPEIAISLAWHRGLLRGPFATTDGRAVEIIHRGTWSHGLGPDFADAMILVDGREVRSGAVEIHRSARGWQDHGHHLDPRYDAVVLHVVAGAEGGETRRHDGAIVPVVVLDPEMVDRIVRPLGREIAPDWSRFGGACCAEELARRRPERLRQALFRLGDARLAVRAARIEARLTDRPPAEILWAELLEGLGYTANRSPMQAVAAALPLTVVEPRVASEPPANRFAAAAALLFGVAGFLPLSPSDAAAASMAPADLEAIEDRWRRWGGAWDGLTVAPTRWTRARVRPANHPVRRLATAAAIVANAATGGGVAAAVLDPIRHGGDPITALARLAEPIGLGADRANDMVASGLLPFALALASHAEDDGLAERAAAAWERLEASAGNAVTRRAMAQVAGQQRLGRLGARGQQGLLQLDTTLCEPRRCFECPIAQTVLADPIRSSEES